MKRLGSFVPSVTIVCVVTFLVGCVDMPTVAERGSTTRTVNQGGSDTSNTYSGALNSSSDPTTKIGKSAPDYSQHQRYALVIGNSAYSKVPSLVNPVNDARDLADALKKVGFQVTKLENAEDKKVMKQAIRDFGARLQGGNTGLFYYSGHGMQVKGENYLIPTNVDLHQEADVEDETLNVNYLLQTIDGAHNSLAVVILDACRDNPFARSLSSGSRGGFTRGLAKMESPAGTILVFATAPGNTAEDGNGRNGTFTKYLLQHLPTPGLNIESMLKRVRNGVMAETIRSQVPWDQSSLTGEFCFAGCATPEDTVEKERIATEKENIKKRQETLEQKDRELRERETHQTSEVQQTLATEQERLRKDREDLEQKRQEMESRLLAAKAAEEQVASQRKNADIDKVAQQALAIEQERIHKEREDLEQKRQEIRLLAATAAEEQVTLQRKNADIDKVTQQTLAAEQERLRKEREDLEQKRQEAEARLVAAKTAEEQVALQRKNVDTDKIAQRTLATEQERLRKEREELEQKRQEAEARLAAAKTAEEKATQEQVALQRSREITQTVSRPSAPAVVGF